MKYGKILVTLFVVAAANSLATIYVTRCGKFSADGSKVAYVSNARSHGGTEGYDIYTVNGDGSDQVRFELKGGLFGEPYFSPDGKMIAFINDNWHFRNRNIFLVDVDGTNLTPVTAYGDDPFERNDGAEGKRIGALGERLAFSPDGRRILYCSAEFGSSDIFAINVDGTGKTPLTAFAGYDESAPVFLPGGDGILFTVKGSWEKAGIWIMNADGSGKKRLSYAEDIELVAVSPDGKKRAYAGRYGETYATYVAALDGSSRFKVADEKPWDLDLSFSPDGKKVLYCLEGRVYVVNADSSGRKVLTRAWDSVSSPAFFAGGAKIAFAGRKQRGSFLSSNIYTMDADGSNLKLFKATEPMGPWRFVVSPAGDRFLFSSFYEECTGDGEGDYFAVNADGSGLARLSECTRYVTRCGKFSADGSKVAYLSNDVSRGGARCAVYTVNADGSAKVRLELKGGLWGEPYFSPDGTKIAFVNHAPSFRNGNVFLVDLDGKNLRRLTKYGDDPYEKTYNLELRIGALDEGLAFSPDGRRVLYCSAEFGSSDIFAVNVDGTGKTQLTDFTDYWETGPVFLPGGDKILFTVKDKDSRFSGEGDIWIMNADGSAKTRLLGPLSVVQVAVSPDGDKIAYADYCREGGSKKRALYVADFDGSSRIKIADEAYYRLDLTFSPDGTKVVYDLGNSIYTINADGSGRKALTPAWDYASRPAFFARGAKIAFSGIKVWSEGMLNLYTVNADGANLKLFKATEGMRVWDLVVSPTGDRFLFHSDYEEYPYDGLDDYFAVNADGSGLKRLTKKGRFPDD